VTSAFDVDMQRIVTAAGSNFQQVVELRGRP